MNLLMNIYVKYLVGGQVFNNPIRLQDNKILILYKEIESIDNFGLLKSHLQEFEKMYLERKQTHETIMLEQSINETYSLVKPIIQVSDEYKNSSTKKLELYLKNVNLKEFTLDKFLKLALKNSKLGDITLLNYKAEGSTKSLKEIIDGKEYDDDYIIGKHEYEKVMDAFRSGNITNFTEGDVDEYLTNGIEDKESEESNYKKVVLRKKLHYITN